MSRSRTILQIVQEVAKLATHGKPSVAVGSDDANAQAILTVLHSLGAELRDEFDWPQLQRKAIVTLVDGQQSYTLPNDFEKLIGESQWNQGTQWRLDGPVYGSTFQALEESTLGSQVWQTTHIRGWDDAQFYVHPTPGTTPGTLTFLYQSWQWIRPQKWAASTAYAAGTRVWNNGVRFTNSLGGTSGTTPPTSAAPNDGGITWGEDNTPYEFAQADSDVPILDTALLTYGTAARFLEQRAFDSSEWSARFEKRLTNVKPRLASAPPINYTRSRRSGLGNVHLPEGNW